MIISARGLEFRELNERVKAADGDVVIDECFGQRFIGAGLAGKTVTIHGTPGNALGAYLDGAHIRVHGNAQDAVGDTMNDGKIVVNGSAGDALGYAMRGGEIFVRDNAGYRTGIHMKEYKDKSPLIVVGGRVGSFLGEYQAGGTIIVLGIGQSDAPVGFFTGTGMHGGRIFIRTAELQNLPAQVVCEQTDAGQIEPHIRAYAGLFGIDAEPLLGDTYLMLRANTKNPYKQLYVTN